MRLWYLLVIFASFLLVLEFYPDLFPYCCCCRKVKMRFQIRIHEIQRIRLGYKAHKSVCRKCCRQYSIHSLKEYERVEDARRKALLKLEL